ncbi:hypothetical protein AOA80_03225 [Methanomassiliicoccales archaeon RumEn M1]|jgi:hypothetical protein|nr:hypothetical protein AOA80_03225 [Methanomassiliicoccales archaeon RumEn M1]
MSEKDSSAEKGKLLYEEKVPRSLRPRRKFTGRRWAFFEALARIFGLAFVFYAAYLVALTDLSDMNNLITLAVCIVGAVTIFYATEVMTPRYIRNIMPMKVYKGGVEVYSSRLERLLGRPSFMPRQDIRGIKLRRMRVLVDGATKNLPVELTFVLGSGKKVLMGRRNALELDAIVGILGRELGIREL